MRRLSIITWACAGLLAACGGKTITGQSTTSSSGTSSTGTTTILSIGSGSGSSFDAGAISISNKSLSAGGSASLQVSVVDQTGALYTTSTQITFNSPCVGQGLASITVAGATTPGTATLTTTTGTANATYVASGCSGPDVITASTTANGQSLSATGTVTVAQAAIGSIAFLTATPTNINIKGTGSTTGSATSTVVFKVLDTSGGPRAGAVVDFSLNTSVGGITISPASATTDANGQVQTIVSGGTVATTVRVTATTTTTAGTTISTQSNNLTISTGVPTSHNISLAVECPNMDSWTHDGVTIPVTVRMTDRFSNPVPDGTTANFYTALGGIQGTCQTTHNDSEAGFCTVNWVSKDPRTIDGVTNGRSPLLVTAIGEESFTDANGNGIFDPGDTVPFNPLISTKAWDDTQEPFLNVHEHYDPTTGVPIYDAGDFFVDFNNNGKHDGPDGFFNGTLCEGPLCSTTQTSVAIGASNIIIMSGEDPVLKVVSPTGPISITQSGAVQINITDGRGQQMPMGTTVAAALSTSTIGGLVPPTSYTWPCSSADKVGQTYTFGFTPPNTPATAAATLTITVTTPQPNVIVTIFSIPVVP
jgi:hypothetical protein